MKSLRREQQIEFYNREIQKILSDYKAYLDSKCIDLLNKGELYIGAFEYIDELRNQVIFSFSKENLPKTKIPLTATKPKTTEVFKSAFKENTYSHYRKNDVLSSSECYGVYYHETNGKFNVGFNSVDVDFLNVLQKEDKIVFGISDPPLKYYYNLIQVTKNNIKSSIVDDILLSKYDLGNFNPTHIENSLELIGRYKDELHNEETIIIQGPPGTGKTFFISRLIAEFSKDRKSVLVATLANRSLLELAKKYFSISDSNKEVVYKSNLTLEESKEVKGLKSVPKDFLPTEGNILLTTFYKMSGLAIEKISSPIYDYVILEEASQCFLGTIAIAKLLGKKVILVGDPLQLPPVVNQDNPNRISNSIDLMLDSFSYYASTHSCPKFRFTTTYRFSENACRQTNTFYENSLKSKSEIQKDNQVLNKLSAIYNNEGGSSLFYYDSSDLKKMFDFIYTEVTTLLHLNPNFEIALLSSTKKGVKLLRDNLLFKFNDTQNRIVVNTVDGVQGLTVDFCFYFTYSEGSPSFSFKLNRFNVATSRSRYCTLILLDKAYSIVKPYKGLVDEFISKCELGVPNQSLMNNSLGTYNKGINKKNLAESIHVESPENNDTQSKQVLKIVDKIDLSKFEKPKKEIKKDKENIYIIDTNVFVDYPDIISKIDKQYQIVLSAKVIDELDYLKISLTEEQKKNVHRAIKQINDSFDKRNLKMDRADLTLLPDDFNKKSPDNFILSVALKYKNENPIMLTSDNGLQIKAKGLDITTITLKDFLKQKKYY
ncbi:MAG: AAA family ATPase [Chitinophagales bacterium]|nr:AAA family ATPase [Chitinophagales bacterium]